MKSMMHVDNNGVAKPGGAKLARPRTAATTTFYDESRIKDKLKFLEEMEQQLTDDIEKVMNEETKGEKLDDYELIDFVKIGTRHASDNTEKGVHITTKMVLEAAMVDSLEEVSTLMLRDKKIELFRDNHHGKENLVLSELCNVESIYANHNLIREIDGIC